ncbi:MAG: ABC transporter permease, partial [Rhodospirillales bacterium]|nr:ABC transporter permease [Rhodospirillales bacterium]
MMATAWRLARREMRGGLKGFRIFLACLALGVAAIAAAGSLNAAMRAALDADARALLGGDVALRLSHRQADTEQTHWLRSSGVLTHQVELRAMARTMDDAGRALVELKAVDQAYPLYGTMLLDPPQVLGGTLEQRGHVWGAVADANLLSRLGLKLGDSIRLGEAVYQLRALIAKEPDRVASLLSFGPRLMVAAASLDDTGLMQPGSLIRHGYMVRLKPGTTAAAFMADTRSRFPQAGWQVRDVSEAAPGVKRFLDNMTLFLTLVGLTALMVGGLGIANAVHAYIEGRVATIAILKSLGASARLVFRVYALQIAALAVLGILLGLALGAAVPALVAVLVGDSLPLAIRGGLYPMPLAVAALFGLLTAAAFSMWPLARAVATPPAALFRHVVDSYGGRPRGRPLALIVLAGLAQAGLTVATAGSKVLAAGFVVGAALALGLFRLLAALISWLAGLAARRRLGGAVLRLALGNLHRPGSPTAAVVVSLGLGLSVLVAVALVEGNLSRELGQRMPRQAPSFFFIDIQQEQAEAFDRTVRDMAPEARLVRAAMVRGRIVRLNDKPVEEVRIDPEA